MEESQGANRKRKQADQAVKRHLDGGEGQSYPNPLSVYEKYVSPAEDIAGIGRNYAAQTAEEWSHMESVQEVGTQFIDSPFYELITAIDSNYSRYWLEKFSTFDEHRFNWSWNWPSFFFGPYRYFFKGIRLRTIFYILAIFVLFYLFELIFGTNIEDGRFLSGLLNLAVVIFFGMRGSHDYYLFCLKYQNDIPGAKAAKKTGIVFLVLLLIFDVAKEVLGWV